MHVSEKKNLTYQSIKVNIFTTFNIFDRITYNISSLNIKRSPHYHYHDNYANRYKSLGMKKGGILVQK